MENHVFSDGYALMTQKAVVGVAAWIAILLAPPALAAGWMTPIRGKKSGQGMMVLSVGDQNIGIAKNGYFLMEKTNRNTWVKKSRLSLESETEEHLILKAPQGTTIRITKPRLEDSSA